MKSPAPDIYDPTFVEALFETMSSSYTRMNTITSFGFSRRWRQQCAALLPLSNGMQVVDLMTGMGEVWPFVLPKIGTSGALTALDFCPAMTAHAAERRRRFPAYAVQILNEDALASSIADASADAVLSTFGLKTFNREQLVQLAAETWRILKPGGSFAMVEVSTPPGTWLRGPYLFYLKQVIPVLGKLFLGDPENYRMLGVYTHTFGNCKKAQAIFLEQGFDVEFIPFFGGCATAIRGQKHKLDSD